MRPPRIHNERPSEKTTAGPFPIGCNREGDLQLLERGGPQIVLQKFLQSRILEETALVLKIQNSRNHAF